MERILIVLFLLAAVQYAGLPSTYDMPIYLVLFLALMFFSYLFLKKNTPTKNTKKDNTTSQERTQQEDNKE